MEERQKLVLFDLDGTLTRKDTLLEIAAYFSGRRRFYAGLLRLTPILFLLKIKAIPNWKAKEKFLTYFLGGFSYDDFQQRCNRFAEEKLPGLFRKEALETLQKFQQEGSRVVIVSTSAENWIAPWCSKEGLLCIATCLEVKDGKVTGKIKGKNCYGTEKVSRIRQLIDLSNYKEIHAYGDSKGDIQMLKLATHPHYRNFDSGS